MRGGVGAGRRDWLPVLGGGGWGAEDEATTMYASESVGSQSQHWERAEPPGALTVSSPPCPDVLGGSGRAPGTPTVFRPAGPAVSSTTWPSAAGIEPGWGAVRARPAGCWAGALPPGRI